MLKLQPFSLNPFSKLCGKIIADYSGSKLFFPERWEKQYKDLKILIEPKNSLIKQYKRLFEFENVKLTFKDDAIIQIAKKAISKKTGARGLRSIIEALLLKIMFKLPTMEDVAEVIVDQSVVKNNTEPLIIYNKGKKTSAA